MFDNSAVSRRSLTTVSSELFESSPSLLATTFRSTFAYVLWCLVTCIISITSALTVFCFMRKF